MDVIFPIPTKSALDSTGPEMVWIVQYPMDGEPAAEIRFSPPLMEGLYGLSPDGKWVIYTFFDPALTTNATAPYGVYLGSLRDSTSRLIYEGEDLSLVPYLFYWSPDSLHFIGWSYQDQMYSGSLAGEMSPPLLRGPFMGWLDATHYLIGWGGAMGEIGAPGLVRTVQLPESYLTDPDNRSLTFVVVKP